MHAYIRLDRLRYAWHVISANHQLNVRRPSEDLRHDLLSSYTTSKFLILVVYVFGMISIKSRIEVLASIKRINSLRYAVGEHVTFVGIGGRGHVGLKDVMPNIIELLINRTNLSRVNQKLLDNLTDISESKNVLASGNIHSSIN